eukprot:SM000020S06097  [mRNA]  locus=s20:1139120:1140021:+ [translate_table: standard]
MDYNGFTGTIPPDFQSMPYLQKIQLAHNKLNGGIPAIPLNYLTHLDLSYNNLTGLLPYNLGIFGRSLQVINLASNRFYGTISTYLGSSPSLRKL